MHLFTSSQWKSLAHNNEIKWPLPTNDLRKIYIRGSYPITVSKMFFVRSWVEVIIHKWQLATTTQN